MIDILLVSEAQGQQDSAAWLAVTATHAKYVYIHIYRHICMLQCNEPRVHTAQRKATAMEEMQCSGVKWIVTGREYIYINVLG